MQQCIHSIGALRALADKDECERLHRSMKEMLISEFIGRYATIAEPLDTSEKAKCNNGENCGQTMQSGRGQPTIETEDLY